MIEKEKTGKFVEKTELRNLQNELKKLQKPFMNILALKGNDPDNLEKLAKELKEIPSVDELLLLFRDWKERANAFLDQAKSVRGEQFKRVESSYIRTQREKSKEIRETNDGWRVGILELATNPITSKVRFLYNREVVVHWKPVSGEGDIAKYEEEALKKLEKYLLPKEALIQYIPLAYKRALTNMNMAEKKSTPRVPILTFYQQFRLLLLQMEMEKKKMDAKLSYAEFPKYAFLYNLDRYFSYSSDLSYSERFILQTGSQQEVARGLGLVVNGLHPLEDYKVMCYVLALGGEKDASS